MEIDKIVKGTSKGSYIWASTLRETCLSNVWIMMVNPTSPKSCDSQIRTRIMCKWILTTSFIIMTMVGMMVDSVRKWWEAFERAPANLKMYSGAKILKAPESLQGRNVGLKFQSKMLRMWWCWNELGANEVPRPLKAYVRYSNAQWKIHLEWTSFVRNASF